MRIRRIAVLAAALAAVGTSLTVGVASAQPATFVGRDDGTGPTLSAAIMAARMQLLGDYGGCTGVIVTSDGQFSDGTWWAWVAGNCTSFR